MAKDPTPEKGKEKLESAEVRQLVVAQPDKFQGLLETITLLDKISERLGEDKSGDLGGSGSGTAQDDSKQSSSSRDIAIKKIPDTPVVRKQLTIYIEKEIKSLRKEVKIAARRASKTGNSYKLNKLYARIRRMNGLLAQLMEASYDVLKRLYIRIFIDKQSVV